MPRQRCLLSVLALVALLVCGSLAQDGDSLNLEFEEETPTKQQEFMTIDKPAGWENLIGQMHQITAKGPHVWGINYRGGTYRWKGRGWDGDAFSPPLRQIAVGFDGHRWGLTPDGRVFRHNGKQWEELPDAPQLEYLDVQDYSRAVGIVMDEDTAWYFDGIRWYPLGVTGKSIAIGPGGQMWLVTNEGAALRYEGRWPAGHFALVAQPPESAIHTLQYCDENHVVVTTAKEELLEWNGNGWTEFPGRGRWFVRSNDHTFALGSDGSMWKYSLTSTKKRRPRAEDTETEEGDQKFDADKFEEKMVV